ncbi:MAG: UvrD-helicase domain-containing protein [Holosporaceae bacterium]|jgi:ATP-dependent helicase/nuclease subunit A|nr:UvrD-helicase domain-containing protein [Holosporaceae bacterium]
MSDDAISVSSGDVFASVWISASAGTGKTKSLIDRILALLLSGAEPSRILCLTYTRAAAAEMLLRLSDILRKFGKMADDELQTELRRRGLGEICPGTAKELCLRSLEGPGVSVRTIHAFCFALLERFPPETGLAPGAKLCDEYQTEMLLREAVASVIADPERRAALEIVAEYSLNLSDIVKKNSMSLRKFIAKAPDFRKLYADFFEVDKKYVGVEEKKIDELLTEEFFGSDYKKIFSEVADALSRGGKTDQKNAEALRKNASNPTAEALKVFLTDKGTIRNSLCSRKISSPELEAKIQNLAFAALRFAEKKKSIAAAAVNAAFFGVAEAVLEKFRELKAIHHSPDFDDVILGALELLRSPDWVTYKIDGALDHILVDEAQDTTPEQWEVIRMLSDEFFSDRSSERTIFAVGDEKQSIYSFQGADVGLFRQMRRYFADRSEKCGQKFRTESLLKSYRTGGNILAFTDAVFEGEFPRHSTFRNPDGGVAEVIDLFEDDPPDENGNPGRDADMKLSDNIADFIKTAVETGVFVESRGRVARPEDFLILFRRRDIRLMKFIIEALKKRHIPVAEIDRMLLKDELIIKDLIALAEFSLFPLDDLTCARVLKSPAVGMGEEELMQICTERGEGDRLWDYLQTVGRRPKNLERCIERASRISPFAFFTEILNDETMENFIRRLGQSCTDALREFLDLLMNRERSDSPSLSGFLEWFASFEHEIKRESFAKENAVRLMTVHASKGLQAPFVLPADCCFIPPPEKDGILKTENGLLLWDFSAKSRPNTILRLLEKRRADEEEEFRRLLYVALTRAEDFLRITGKKPRGESGEKCWYGLIRNGLKQLKRVESEGLYRIGDYELRPPTAETSIDVAEFEEIPSGFDEKLPLPEEAPSHPEQNSEMIYGDCVHALLSELPPYVDSPQADEISKEIAEKFALSETQKTAARAEALRVIRNSEFAFLFSVDAKSEISFVCEGREGRIDKIARRGEELWIVDFKTGSPRETVPESYFLQLKFYEKAVRQITGHADIHTAILWTAIPSLQEIDVSRRSES